MPFSRFAIQLNHCVSPFSFEGRLRRSISVPETRRDRMENLWDTLVGIRMWGKQRTQCQNKSHQLLKLDSKHYP